MNKKGFTTVELVISFIMVIVILTSLIGFTIAYRDKISIEETKSISRALGRHSRFKLEQREESCFHDRDRTLFKQSDRISGVQKDCEILRLRRSSFS